MTAVARAALVGVLVAAALAVGLAPWAHDLPSRDATGLEAPDDGYWTAPTRRLAGAGEQDDYDHDLALSLALPQNALAAAAVALGVPYGGARLAGSLLGAAVLAAVAALWLRGRRHLAGFALLVTLATPPVLGHVLSDLGEGTALGLCALWATAALGRRWTFAGAIAALALSQKASGLALGLGTLVGVLADPTGRATALRRAAVGVAAGLSCAVGLAVVVFGDAPFAFLLRPWTATHDTGAGSHGWGWLVQAAFPGAHGVGASWAPAALAVAIVAALAPARRPSPAVLAATVAAFLFAGAFPDPWRVLPALPLLVATLVDDPHADRDASTALRALPLVLALAQVVGALAAAVATAKAVALVAATVAAVVAVRGAGRWLVARPRVRAVVLALPLAWAVGASGHLFRAPATARRALADEVASRLPADASLVGYSFLSSAFRGRLYYPPFDTLWADELARRAPTTLYRLRVPAGDVPPPGPAGYRVVRTDDLGARLYNRELRARPLVLDTLAPPPGAPR